MLRCPLLNQRHYGRHGRVTNAGRQQAWKHCSALPEIWERLLTSVRTAFTSRLRLLENMKKILQFYRDICGFMIDQPFPYLRYIVNNVLFDLHDHTLNTVSAYLINLRIILAKFHIHMSNSSSFQHFQKVNLVIIRKYSQWQINSIFHVCSFLYFLLIDFY